MKTNLFYVLAILGIALTISLTSCETGDDYDPYYPDCEDCDDNNDDNDNDNNDDNNNDNQDPVDGADLTIYLDVSQFESVYGQLEKNGDEYLNFYGANRSVHVDLSSYEVITTGKDIISIADANAEAAKKGYDGVSENLYYDHVQKIWIWVYNKDDESFMMEMQKITWTLSPSAKDRFFDYEFEIKNSSKELWITVNDKKIAFVAGLDS